MTSHLFRKPAAVVLVLAVVAVLVLGVSACGGGKPAASATEQWAGGVCSAFTTWKDSLDGIKSDLKSAGLGGLSGNALTKAANQADDATKTLVQSLKKLGVPETAQSQAAKKNLTALENSLTQGLTSIEDALKSGDTSLTGVATTLATVTTELGNMATALSTSVGSLKQLNPGSDLEKAFKQAPSCSAYVSS
jgi:hypothetical protein